MFMRPGKGTNSAAVLSSVLLPFPFRDARRSQTDRYSMSVPTGGCPRELKQNQNIGFACLMSHKISKESLPLRSTVAPCCCKRKQKVEFCT